MRHTSRASWMVDGLLLTLGFGLVGACSSAGSPAAGETIRTPRVLAECQNNGAGLGIGTGADGVYAPAVNGTFPQVATRASGTAGSTTLTVGSDTGFAVGNIVLVHQTQGTNAGVWEIEDVTAVTATTLTLALPLQNSYASDATDAAQAVRVPQYTNVTIGAGRIITAPAWNGTTGGLLPFLANGTVLLNGTLQANGAGYRGGVGDGGNNTCPGTPKAGFQGESSVGVGARSTTANGEAGGGGGTLAAFCCSGCPATQGTTGDSGGGGGGYGVAGTAGMGSAVVGLGGGAVGPTNLTSLFFGGGGGAGGGNCTVSSPPGGPGGGAIVISAATMTVGAAGVLEANGVTPGINGAMNWEGGGGGGAGGAIEVSATTLTVPANTVSATGAIGAEQCAGNGGNGGAGRVRVACGTLNGASCAVASGTFSNPTAVVGAFCSFATCTTNSECATATPATPVCNPTTHACVQCDANGDCTGNPSGTLCDTTKNTCGTCTLADTAPCTGITPVCDVTPAHDKCAACTGDFGTITAEPCETASLPVCVLTGATAGACVQCASNSDCTGNANGPLCDTTKSTCGTCTAANVTACTGTTPVCNVTGTNDKCAPCTGNFGTTAAEPCETASLPACLLTGATAGACVQCGTSADCGTAAAPVCSATNTCVACNGDNGSAATEACPSAASPYCAAGGTCGKCVNDTSCTTGTHPGPFCNPTTGSCGTACFTDADCGAGNWCNETAHMCTPQLANGVAVPTDAAHTGPTLNGTCTAAAGTVVCVSGVCDTKDNECGFANGDGPCTGTNGNAVCRSNICATTGVNSGLCEACVMDSQCPSATPSCNLTTNACAQCTTSAMCPTADPVCNPASSACATCNGDNGSTATLACPTSGEPFCFLSGSTTGTCGKCGMSSDCAGHTGDICDTTSGLCTSTCATDADCMSSQWCNAAPGARGMCVAKLANGTTLPTTPTTVATCTATVGMRVCISTVCDAKTNQCGFAVGDGPCTTSAECIMGSCDPTTEICVPPDAGVDAGHDAATEAGAGCKEDSQCGPGDFCATTEVCTPRLPAGSTCDRAAECLGEICASGVCSYIVSSGNGLCSVRAPGSSGDARDSGAIGLLLALAGLGYRRRRSLLAKTSYAVGAEGTNSQR